MDRARSRRTIAKRGYTLGLRAAEADERRERILRAATDLLLRKPYEEVTLQVVATEADVALKTVVRHFGTKDALVVACAESLSKKEERAREVPPGDIAAAARVLAGRYEALGEVTGRLLALEARIPAIAQVLGLARQSHLGWLEQTFAPWLSARAPKQKRARLAQLFGATEIFVWTSWRTHLGLDVAEAEAALCDSLTALVTHWTRKGGK